MFFPTGLVALILILVSGYALVQSLTSIANIKTYESKAEKAADWSNTAKKRLWDTRYTIGTGFVSVSARVRVRVRVPRSIWWSANAPTTVSRLPLHRGCLLPLRPLRRRRAGRPVADSLARGPGCCAASGDGPVHARVLGNQSQGADGGPVQRCHLAEHGRNRSLGRALCWLGDHGRAEAGRTVMFGRDDTA